MALASTHLSILSLTAKPTAAFSQFGSQRTSLHLVRAGSSGPGDGTDESINSSSKSKKIGEEDDARYVLKLGVGSLAGAAVIKYGSVLVPQVTTPNLPEALFIIITPLIAAVLILLAKTRISP